MNNSASSFLLQFDEYYLDLDDKDQLRYASNEQMRTRPFPGLRPFKSSESQLFHGRDGQAEELVKRLEKQHFLAVIGSSGSGKSSLVRAGLIPQLLGGFLRGAGTSWKIVICKPGKDPVENLGIGMARVKAGTNDEDKIRQEFEKISPVLETNIYGILEVNETLNQNKEGLAEPVTKSPNLLIIIDQFEELFRFGRSDLGKPGIEKHFVDLLLKASANPAVPVYVIITMRSEFLGDCASYRGLPEAINAGQYLVPKLGREQISEVISDPIMLAGKTIAPGLVQLLVNETEKNTARYSQDQLPILQHALMRTFQEAVNSGSTAITIDHYKKVGGMEKALANHAESKYNDLGTPGQKEASLKQQIARLIFQALTDTSTDQKGGRRPTSVKVIYGITASINATPEQVDKVINAFRDADTSFILPPLHVELTPDLVLDISHESLMRQWSHLREWVDEESGYSQVMNRLVQANALYEANQKGLLERKELAPIAAWYHSFNPQPAWAERYSPDYKQAFEYLDKSEKATRRKKALTAAFGILAVILVIGGLYLINSNLQDAKQHKLENRKDFIVRGQSAIQYGDPLTGSLLLAEALNLGDAGDTLLKKSNELMPTFFLKDVFTTSLQVQAAAFSENSDSLLLWDKTNDKKKNTHLVCHIMTLSNRLIVDTNSNRKIDSLPGQDEETALNGLMKLFKYWGIDDSGNANILNDSFTLTLNVPNNYRTIYNATLSPDSSLLLATGRNKNGHFVANLYNMSTGRQFGPTMVHTRRINIGIFNSRSDKIMTWALDRSIRIYNKATDFDPSQGDLDFPVTLFKTQLEAVTGAQLNKSLNGLMPVDVLGLQAIIIDWKEKAEAHYKTCRYKAFNYWAHCYPEKAKEDDKK